MDLNNLATQENAEAGDWFPVELYGKKQNFDLKIYGDDSDVVQKFIRKSSRKFGGAVGDLTKGKMPDDKTLDEMKEDDKEAVLIRICGIRGWNDERTKAEPVLWDGKELKDEPATYKFLLEKIPALKNFILKIARDRTNFLSKPSGN